MLTGVLRFPIAVAGTVSFLVLISLSVSAADQENVCLPAANQALVRFTYGSEKQPWIHEVTETFNRQAQKTASGKTICVNAVPKGSGDSVNEIKNGQAGPGEVHATSPASDLYVNLINHEFTEEQGKDLLKVEGFLVSSPVVIAAWEPVLARLGPPDQIGWSEIFKRSGDGGFRYGQTSPEQSNSGLSALVAQFYAGAANEAGRPVPRLSLARIEDPKVREFVAKVHESVIHYGRSTGFYAEKMRSGGPEYADTVVIYESDVIQANNHIRDQGLKYPKLVAIYPREGTFATNHPFTIVKRDWVDADEEDGAKRYFAYLMAPETQAKALQYGFRPSVPLDIDPKVYGIVWNPDNGVQPFDTVHRFLATPGGNVIQAIRDAFRAIKNHSHVVLVIDRSGSMDARLFDTERGMERSRMEMAVESANLLAQTLQDKDRLSLLFYDYKVQYSDLTPKGQPLAMDAAGKERLAETLAKVRPAGGTAMRSAIETAWRDLCETIKKNPSDRAIRLMVVLTDGVDNASKISDADLIQRIGFALPDGHGGYLGDAACKIPVFGIAFGGEADDSSLKAIGNAAGGETRRGDSAEIREIFKRFSDLL
ncbi:substrate-binding domain-containing protein [Thiocystis violascens]|uniref:Spermidine/putrescine-binding periplasmic protein n=1 Tax=Thiocystis violascens (strain ATCC 17096 / DSM 198 / 6111) TaxID=765911 RepID=I3YEK5_THIV6|nr:extracellular solute-binding protein [Thiocystis violascens]AFL75423.1 spermidine/putrescine-binding periplasmic protein [Thiocystis violascens DSM 198]